MNFYKIFFTSLVFIFSTLFSALSQSQDLFPPTIQLDSDEHVRNSAQLEGEAVFEAVVEDDVKISHVMLYFRQVGQAAYQSKEMRLVQNTPNIYTAKIKFNDRDVSRIEYYIDAEDSSGNFTLKGQQFNPLLRDIELSSPYAANALLKEERNTDIIVLPAESESSTRSNIDTAEEQEAESSGSVSKFYVKVEPIDARVRIMNIEPKYVPGIELTRGDSYRVMVDKVGFQSYDNWIVPNSANVMLDVALVLNSDNTLASESNSCSEAVQNRIAWDYSGSKSWLSGNIEILCGDVGTTEPAKCFSTIMHGEVDWGGGTKWQWQNALSLCAKSQNASLTVQCFQENIQEGSEWDMAIALCKKL